MKNVYLSEKCIGSLILVDAHPDYYGDSKTRSEAPVGTRYEVMMPLHRFEKLTVKVPGEQQVETPLSGSEPHVEFADLRVKPYVDSRTGRLAFTASATGIKVIGTDVGGKSPVKG